MIDVVDVFAGPGGLGEGFAGLTGSSGKQIYDLKVSIERDVHAHETLRLRAFRRRLGNQLPLEYWKYVRGECGWPELRAAEPAAAKAAEQEAIKLALSRATSDTVRKLVTERVTADRAWVLIGGPPCQAYSLVGRSRNRGVTHYRPSRDKRHVLYLEYLQILSDHAPPVFVMENVKGLLSARYMRQPLFERIAEDLTDPDLALRREGRRVSGPKPKYELLALTSPQNGEEDTARRFIVRAEHFGVPQRRHRVIIVGIRSDIRAKIVKLHEDDCTLALGKALTGLPPLRSGIRGTTDGFESWMQGLRDGLSQPWVQDVPTDVVREMRNAVRRAAEAKPGRGEDVPAEVTGQPVLNHSTRGHMGTDLHRYLFASAFAVVNSKSPTLSDFPRGLLPKHRNIKVDVGESIFADRFRVQLREQPATTVTSHIAKDGHYYIHYDPWQCRSLTVREAARVQTFPDDYFFCGPRTSQYHQVGNAVPPKLGEKIARVVSALCGV